MPSRMQTLLKVTVLSVFVAASAHAVAAQLSTAEFQKILRAEAGFADDDFSELERGKTVVKLLPVEDEREVAVFGIVRLPVAPGISLSEFQNSLTQRNNKSVLEYGRFAKPPAAEDLQSLTLEKGDIEALKKCSVGNCNLKLPAAMIKRVRTEVDWNAPDFELPATQLFRRMIFEYVQDYAARGNEALLTYENRKKPLGLEAEHRELLASLRFIKSIAPELAGYLQNFPRLELAGAENDLYWSKVKFGLKPIVTVNHTTAYSRQTRRLPQYLVVTKQIYASRYVDSSLALTMLLHTSENEADSAAYILFTNHSRSDALDGLFSGFKRGVVKQEAVERVKDLLRQTKMRLANRATDQSGAASEPAAAGITARLWRELQKPLGQLFLLLFLAVLGCLVYRRLKRGSGGQNK